MVWDSSSSTSLILSILKVVGLVKLLELAFRVAATLRRNLRTTEHLSDRYGERSWAVITGASDGIGLAMAKELARRNFNIVIIARSQSKMDQAASEIKGVRSVEVKTVLFDFTKTANHAVQDY